jgi:hypothetical protein
MSARHQVKALLSMGASIALPTRSVTDSVTRVFPSYERQLLISPHLRCRCSLDFLHTCDIIKIVFFVIVIVLDTCHTYILLVFYKFIKYK